MADTKLTQQLIDSLTPKHRLTDAAADGAGTNIHVVLMTHAKESLFEALTKLVDQSKEANKLRAALAQALDEWEAWAEESPPGGQIDQRQLDDIAELRKLVS